VTGKELGRESVQKLDAFIKLLNNFGWHITENPKICSFMESHPGSSVIELPFTELNPIVLVEKGYLPMRIIFGR